jgi:hypothetical protein
MIGRRGELIAELFLQDLEPEFLARSTADFDYDFLVGFRNSRGGINNIAVEVKATERLVGDRCPISMKKYERWAHSNIPVLLLVVAVKENRLFYSLVSSDVAGSPRESRTITIQLTEIDEKTKKELRDQLAK